MDPRTIEHSIQGPTLAAMLCLWATAASVPSQDAGRRAQTLAVVELRDGPTTLEALREALTPLPEGLPPEVAASVGLGLLTIRGTLGRSLEELVELLVPGPASLAVVAANGRPVPIFASRVRQRETVASLLDELPEAMHSAWHGDVLVLSSDPRGLLFPPPLRDHGSGNGLRFQVDLEQIMALDGNAGASLIEGMDGGERFFFGPWVRMLDRTTDLEGTLTVDRGGLVLTARLDASIVGDAWEGITAHGSRERRAPAPPAETVAFVSLDRNIRGLFQNPARFLSEEDATAVQDFLVSAELETFLRGASFVDDLLGSLLEPVHVYVLDVEDRLFPEDRPRIRLPSLALVSAIRDEESVKTLKNTLDRIVQVLLLVGSFEESLFRIRPEKGEGFTGMSMEPMEWYGPGQAPTEYGLSATLLFGQRHVILASTRSGAMSILESLAAGRTVEIVGDHVEIRGPALAEVFERNRSVLELTRVLGEGETVLEAERFWRTVNAVVGAIPSLRLEVRPGKRTTTVELRIGGNR